MHTILSLHNPLMVIFGQHLPSYTKSLHFVLLALFKHCIITNISTWIVQLPPIQGHLPLTQQPPLRLHMAITISPLATPAQRPILFILPLQHMMRLGSQRMTHTLGKPALILCNEQAAHRLQDII